MKRLLLLVAVSLFVGCSTQKDDKAFQNAVLDRMDQEAIDREKEKIERLQERHREAVRKAEDLIYGSSD